MKGAVWPYEPRFRVLWNLSLCFWKCHWTSYCVFFCITDMRASYNPQLIIAHIAILQFSAEGKSIYRTSQLRIHRRMWGLLVNVAMMWFGLEVAATVVIHREKQRKVASSVKRYVHTLCNNSTDEEKAWKSRTQEMPFYCASNQSYVNKVARHVFSD